MSTKITKIELKNMIRTAIKEELHTRAHKKLRESDNSAHLNKLITALKTNGLADIALSELVSAYYIANGGAITVKEMKSLPMPNGKYAIAYGDAGDSDNEAVSWLCSFSDGKWWRESSIDELSGLGKDVFTTFADAASAAITCRIRLLDEDERLYIVQLDENDYNVVAYIEYYNKETAEIYENDFDCGILGIPIFVQVKNGVSSPAKILLS